MPTYVATGKALTLSIDGDSWSPQTSSVTLNYQNNVETVRTLSGSAAVVTGTEGTLEVTGFQDYGEGSSLFDALWTAAEGGTAVGFSLAINGVTFTGDVIPQFPSVGGGAVDALSSDISFTIDGSVTKA